MRESGKCRKRAKGFSLLELMVSLAVFLVVAGTIMSSMMSAQKSFRTSEIRTGLEQTMRSALEMMAQDIGQAGLQPSGVDSKGLGAYLTRIDPNTCNTGSPIKCISGSTVLQWVQVTSVAGIYKGEWLWVDVGPGAVGAACYPAKPNDSNSYCEHVVVNDIAPGPPARIQAIFQVDHLLRTVGSNKYSTPFYGMGSYPQGIVPSPSIAPAATTTTYGGSTSSQLELFGDIDGAGNSLRLVIYKCPTSSPGNFTRTVYDAADSNPAKVPLSQTTLLSNVTQCSFSYPNPVPVPAFLNIPVVTSVGISLEAQSQTKDPQTGQPIKIKKSFLNIQPRNIISALNQVSSCATSADSCLEANELQKQLPPGVQ